MDLPLHGANPAHFLEALGLHGAENKIDFSVNTNPLGPPKFIEEEWSSFQRLVTHYPDPSSKRLKQKIASQNSIKSNQVIIGNGAAELIYLVTSLFQKKKVLLVEPTFSEYREASETFECQIESFFVQQSDGWLIDSEKLASRLQEVDLLFICNPNNPTGVMYKREVVTEIVAQAAMVGTTVVIDEAFYDFSIEQQSVATLVHTYSNCIIIRSLTKMYAIAGLRLGYAIASPSIIDALEKRQHPWNVNGLALVIGERCLLEYDFVRTTVQYVAKERKRCTEFLINEGYDISPSAVNYYLLKESGEEKDLQPFMTFLIERGIIPRHTYYFSSLDGKYLRLAVKTKEENDQLLSACKEWKS
ncbi:threonine-phosphate decarboxylase CobD [Bacillus alkalicellulosilyticus]|uniref:threonine-phosphate decarboxylase CobD n=1 Tax=Alkalihalobacterium alkalicellulosilyticum TaxID=1912214 RepID=UPI001482B9F7|nr:threonine-phosphate decarboxylase CobD [Bacillus alkalicellulosilyticus]